MEKERVALLVLLIVLAGSCSPEEQTHRPDRYDRVFLCYMSGYNDLSPYLEASLQDMSNGVLPSLDRSDAVVVLTHNTKSHRDYVTPTSPCLVQYYRNKGQCVMDTLKTYPAGTNTASAETMRIVLEDLAEFFPSDSYGMLYSSHATGFLPFGYYGNRSRQRCSPSSNGSDDYPLTKSVGAHYDTDISLGMELVDFVGAIPYKFDFIIFDACLMGGIEVAWQLREVCDRIVASPSEVLAHGFIYEPPSVEDFRLQGS